MYPWFLKRTSKTDQDYTDVYADRSPYLYIFTAGTQMFKGNYGNRAYEE